jgi:hypothetical protein
MKAAAYIKTTSSSGCPLTPRDVGDLLPLLHGHYPASSLLRSSAPLISASLLSASWVAHLCLFPFDHRPGSQVPYESPNKSHASPTGLSDSRCDQHHGGSENELGLFKAMIRIRGCCTTLTEPIVEGPALSIWTALRQAE